MNQLRCASIRGSHLVSSILKPTVIRFQTSPCFKIRRRSPSTARISVADSKSSKESKLFASSIPNCLEFWVLAEDGVEVHPVVKPIPATADVMTDNLNKKDADGCHTAVVGLYIQIPNNV